MIRKEGLNQKWFGLFFLYFKITEGRIIDESYCKGRNATRHAEQNYL